MTPAVEVVTQRRLALGHLDHERVRRHALVRLQEWGFDIGYPRRTPFTSKDEDYLAQYIAKYNPKPSGRKGNALYLQLVENVRTLASSSDLRLINWCPGGREVAICEAT